MIIACPACQTRYVVPDSAIGVEGRTVRCAKCKHSWYQDGAEADAVAASQASAPEPTKPTPPPPPQPAPTRPRTPVEDEAPAAPPVEEEPEGPDFDEGDTHPVEDTHPGEDTYREEEPPPPPVEDDDYSRFDHEPPFKPRRNPVKLWTYAAAVFAFLALGTVLAVNYVGMPDWVPVSRPLFGAAQPDLELSFPIEEQERRTLSDGTEYFGAKIIVTNTARESRPIPPILIVLRDQRERLVFSWVVNPPQSTLAPGEVLTIDEAIADVPKSAVFADIGWAPR